MSHHVQRPYPPVTKGITLTTNSTADFLLEPGALLVFGGDVAFAARADGSFDMRASGRNAGTSCAVQIAGIATITNPRGEVLTYTRNLPAPQKLQPGESFDYAIGIMTRDQAFRFPDGLYTVKATFAPAACS
jgi:hypothetical protein